ncbi:periplasmic dipeptide transport protein precursor (dipeptide-binding protein) (DBP) [Phaeobacter piscinae]|uniref:Periplasmic dipeptide transport protein (Dipeptide-binding protein) (DBP) n=1 Tax=Phaeobacter piscinae TaxID=1580596 RepID=A0ABN5DJV3_9RHOB|nr:peptide ABC transporter substrate-binding protein [Phaeobacter piscinae]ATG37138.1 periplasmic dipeptide transport protein precursor (dipeptide-binding protein) (DBP) [Phaeobacter piscinae]AUQ87659.1 periplasmic dipeptide transport protein precursor (dipeptide-binding protein) (DBP) [Phaeobacter piscinae]AUR25542.1 periplasmic dipeptide transport protein precursor (dipeptide-binding protein) (DBP) [Phaeobacter piscinae]
MKIRTTLVSSALVLGLALQAQAADVPEGTKLAEDQSYTFWLLDAIKSMDPQINTDVEGSDVLRNLFEGLYNEDGNGELVPGVALDHEASADGKTYTFNLRQDAKWSNGEPVTAGDFVYAWRRLADPATASEYAWYMELMQVENAPEVIAGDMPPEKLGVRAVDDHTLEVKITTPLPYFPQMLVHGSTFPVLQSQVEEHGDDWTDAGKLVGNGAFTLTEHQLGERVVMEKSDTYWDAENVVMEKLTALTINDVNQGLTRYLAGELDRVDIPAGQYPRLKKEYPEQAVSTPYNCSYIYMLNIGEKGPEALRDVRVRKALAYAIDRDIIVERILQGGQKASYNWTHWAIADFDRPELEWADKMDQAQRLEAAKALMAEAGYSRDNPLDLTLQYNTSEDHKKIAIAASQMLKQIGVNITLDNYEWKIHTDRMQNQDYDMARYAWCGDYNEASTYLDLLTSYSGHNNGEFHNDAYDQVMKDSKTAKDPQPLYQEAERILAEEMPIIPIYHYANVDMIAEDIKGLPENNVNNNWYGKDLYRIAE